MTRCIWTGGYLAAFKKGDERALGYIFDLHRTVLIYFAEKLLGVREEAEEIVGNSFMKLWARHTNFDSLPAIKSFLYVTARNACFDFLKHSKRISAYQKDFFYWSGNKEEEILHIMYEAEIIQELDREIELLPKKCRHVFNLAFYEGLNTGEIAGKLGLSVHTVRNQRAKAVQVLRTSFFKRKLILVLLFSLMFASIRDYSFIRIQKEKIEKLTRQIQDLQIQSPEDEIKIG